MNQVLSPAATAISPAQARMSNTTSFPEFMITSINDLISLKFGPNDKAVTIKQDDIVKLAVKKLQDDKSTTSEVIKLEIAQAGAEYLDGSVSDDAIKKAIFNNGWLNFESIFEKAGWLVSYDKPGFAEQFYPPTFTFTAKE